MIVNVRQSAGRGCNHARRARARRGRRRRRRRAPPAPSEEKLAEQKQPKTLWDEFKLRAFIETGHDVQPERGQHGDSGADRRVTNELRYYDFNQGYTFNMAEFSIKTRSRTRRFRSGWGWC